MSRELKFRAWDGSRIIHFDNMQIGINKNHKKNDRTPYVYFENDTFGDHVSLKKHDIMQFTGLSLAKKSDGFNKDGNYKTFVDLYELDIVELKANPSFYVGSGFVIGALFVCAYCVNGYVLLPVKEYEAYIKHGSTSVSINGTRALNSHELYLISNHFEVIGNIYQNPDLL